ncbi:unnamed protein product [Calicophoron daubneyi]|uniref:Uncharacterized protein n=1 Tax=Calicophoron daubneyi TaxID=300641 RepID=A0AAV2T6I0_CALDB
MCKRRFTLEYDGISEDKYSLRGILLPEALFCFADNPYYFSSLQIKQTLSFHEGCVNTVIWDDAGECLLSGSDDRQIAITRIFPNPSQSAASGVVFHERLPAESNVFSAKFLPYTSDSHIIVGCKCGCLLSVRVDAAPGSRVEPVHCHGYAVYDILTLPDQPACFLTLSHDQTVVCFDSRIPFSPNRTDQRCNQQCTYLAAQTPSTPRRKNPGVQLMKLQFPVTAGDVHPLDGSRRIAIACADGFVRLFDLRRFTAPDDSSSATGGSSQPSPYLVVRPLKLPAQLTERSSIRLDYGPAHITSVQFEPIYPTTFSRFTSPIGARDTYHRAGYGGRNLLVSHMYAPVFLFDTSRVEDKLETELPPVDWLPDRIGDNDENSSADSPNSSDESRQRISRVSQESDLDLRLAIAFFHWLERQRLQRLAASAQVSVDRNEGPQDNREPSNTPAPQRPRAPTPSEPRPPVTDQPSDDSEEPAISPLELLTDEYVAKVLASAPRCRQIMAYRGRRSCRTVIKASVFWGRDYILSGSECGHVIAWNRWSGEPVSVIEADRAVVNRIAPHPRLPIFACSGIDRTVKLVEPNPGAFTADLDELRKNQAEEAQHLCDENSDMMRESLRSGSLRLDRLARLRTGQAIRNILRRIGNASNRP